MPRSLRKTPTTEFMRVEKTQAEGQNDKKTIQEQKVATRYVRHRPPELRRLAAMLRCGKPAERAEEAARLEGLADGLCDPEPTERKARMGYWVTVGNSAPELLDREGAALAAGVTMGSLSVLLSRSGGTWKTRKRVGRHKLIQVVVSRKNPTRSKQAELPE